MGQKLDDQYKDLNTSLPSSSTPAHSQEIVKGEGTTKQELFLYLSTDWSGCEDSVKTILGGTDMAMSLCLYQL